MAILQIWAIVVFVATLLKELFLDWIQYSSAMLDRVKARAGSFLIEPSGSLSFLHSTDSGGNVLACVIESLKPMVTL